MCNELISILLIKMTTILLSKMYCVVSFDNKSHLM